MFNFRSNKNRRIVSAIIIVLLVLAMVVPTVVTLIYNM